MNIIGQKGLFTDISTQIPTPRTFLLYIKKKPYT